MYRISGRKLCSDELLPLIPTIEVPFEVSGVSFNSKELVAGDLFIDCADSRFNEEAIRNGAKVIISKKIVEGINTLVHPDPQSLVSKIGDIYFYSPTKKLLTIGVTGTNGKTTTTNILSQLINLPHTLIGTLGAILPNGEVIDTGLTTPGPFAIQSIAHKTLELGGKALIMEVSSHALDQARVSGVTFSGAIFTNLTQDHLDYHQTMENYFESKAKLFSLVRGEGVVFGDEWGKELKKRFPWVRLIESVEVLEVGLKGSKFILDGKEYSIPLIGEFNIYNTALALSLLSQLGLDHKNPNSLKGIKGRLEQVTEGVFVDYSHTPDSLYQALKTLRALTDRPITVVFGCGGDRDKSKRPLMGEIACKLADKVIITSDNPRTEDPKEIIKDILRGCTKDVLMIEDREKAIVRALDDQGPVVLIAGKGHEEYQIIGTEKRYFSDQEVVRRVRGKVGI